MRDVLAGFAPLEHPPSAGAVTQATAVPTTLFAAIADAEVARRTIRRLHVRNTTLEDDAAWAWVVFVEAAADVAGVVPADARGYLVRPSDGPLDLPYRGHMTCVVVCEGSTADIVARVSDVLVP
jgi:hypothetical protein